MARSRPRRLFALDQNFPEPIVDCLASYVVSAELVPIRRIHGEMSRLDDWQLMVALHNHERAWDGLITNDDKLLALPKEMTVLGQTRLTLVVVRSQGHNPVRATGVLLSHLDHVCHHTTPDGAQIWVLGVSQKQPEAPRDRLERIARNENKTVAQLVSENSLPASALTVRRT
jgi:hypothetical protein